MSEKFLAGAGQDIVHFGEELFPIYSNPVEKYVGVHDEIKAKVLVMERQQRHIMIMVETVIFLEQYMDRIREAVADLCGTEKEYVWFCVTHSLATPHFGIPFPGKPQEMIEKDEQIYLCYEKAILSAAEAALQSLCPASVDETTAVCHVNVNRNVETADGWWLGIGEEGPTDPEVVILRFLEEETGKTIAVYYNYNCQPSVMGDTDTEGDGRLISADFAGAASRYIERQLDVAVAMYSIGAGGDQGPRYKACMDLVGKDGIRQNTDIHTNGFILADMQGQLLGQQVVKAVDRMADKSVKAEDCALGSISFTVKLKGQDAPPMHEIHPARSYEFKAGKEKETEVNVLSVGDSLLIGVQPELSYDTEVFLKEAFPEKRVAVMTFVNGGAKYMAEEEKFDRITFQAMNSPFARGECEKYRTCIVEEIRNWQQKVR